MPKGPTGPVNTSEVKIQNVVPPANYAGASYSNIAINAILGEGPEYLFTFWGIHVKENPNSEVGLFLTGMKDGIKTEKSAPPCPPNCIQGEDDNEL
jgi:hypothetical protein